jgi:hypothetical protein
MTVALGAARPAAAGHGGEFTATGTVAVGNPHVTYYGVWTPANITDQFARCDPDSEYNGLDGMWLDIGGFWTGAGAQDRAGHTAVLTMDPDTQFAVSWYDEDCRYTGEIRPWPGPVDPPSGLGETIVEELPSDARYAIVMLRYGADATFTLTLS